MTTEQQEANRLSAVDQLIERFKGCGTWVLTAGEVRELKTKQARIHTTGSKRARIRNRRKRGGLPPKQLGLLL